jgi:hypothetical protein
MKIPKRKQKDTADKEVKGRTPSILEQQKKEDQF